jgi:TetR/AcrR family transcriptional repressor of nem operon
MMTIMRYPEGHKEEVRERVVRAAATALRRDGLAGIGIPALMKRAGLTHGAFYSHFADRAELVAEAIASAASDTAGAVFGEGVPLRETLARYLSAGHLDHPEQGCVIAALGTDGHRQPARVRRAFAEVARGFLRLVQTKLRPDAPAGTISDEALRLASTMIGAVVLGRLVGDPTLAARLLRAARSELSA